MTQIYCYSQVCKLPNHLRIYQFPDELEELGFQKLKFANDHWAQFDSECKPVIKICYAPDFYGEIKYPENVIVEQSVILTKEQFERFKHLISPEYKKQLEERAQMEHKTQIEEFKSLISKDEFSELLLEWTTNYITELFGEDYAEMFNMQKLAKSAEEDIIESIYSYYEQFKGLDEEERLKVKRWIIDEEDWESMVDKEDEYFVSDITCNLDYKLFYDHYPCLKHFADQVAGLTKGDYPNGDCMGGKVEETNQEYNRKLLNYAWTLLEFKE